MHDMRVTNEQVGVDCNYNKGGCFVSVADLNYTNRVHICRNLYITLLLTRWLNPAMFGKDYSLLPLFMGNFRKVRTSYAGRPALGS